MGVFKDIGFSLELENNLKEVDLIEVKFNLRNRTYPTYKKPNDGLLYVHILSNHPPDVIKQIRNSIHQRLSHEETFNTGKCEYKDTLKKISLKLILNTPKINDRNQKIDLEILFGSIHHSTKQYPQVLQKYFFD